MLRYSIAIVAAMLLQGQNEALQLTPDEEKDSYAIYSMLLKREMPASWNITGWVIERETRTFYSPSQPCLPSGSPASVYQPIVDDYVKRNRRKFLLERKFDLPRYAVIDVIEIRAFQNLHGYGLPSVPVEREFPYNARSIFHVSAVGFSADRTHALVYAGHDCGNLCGGGTYHWLVKIHGTWELDRDVRGTNCSWAS